MRRSRSAFPVIPAFAVALIGGAAWMFWPWSGETADSGRTPSLRPPVPEVVITEEPSRADMKTGFEVEAPSLPPETAETRPPAPDPAPQAASEPAEQAAGSPIVAPTESPLTTQEAAGGDRTPTASEIAANKQRSEFGSRVDAAVEQYRAGKRIEARTALNEMLLHAESAEQRTELRRHLERIAEEMIWSRERTEGDPLVDLYVVKPGDKLGLIAKPYDIPYELILQVNGLSDPSKIRANQKLKILRGPFNARVYKGDFRLDLYLQDTFVKSFRVGLGGDNPTPVGEWIVSSRMRNPTYFPSASAKDKRVVPPNDPANPLGGFWVGLQGTSGDAVGQSGFGIHGTNEPESIGRAASLGCVRMLNDEIEIVFRVMLVEKSKVTTLP